MTLVATPRKTPGATRKRPTQERSRATVDRLIDASARVLTADGYHRASTNRIAAEAGVSPGTLYQYFSNKNELVAAVIERLVDAFAASIAPALRQAAGEDAATGTRTVLDAILTQLAPQASLLDALVDRIPGEQYHEAIVTMRTRVEEVVFHLMAAQRPELSHEELGRRTWLLVSLVLNLTIRYLLDRPPISHADFVDDLTRLSLEVGLG